MRIDVMVDIETLGTDIDATIFQIAAVGFDIHSGAIVANFNETADISKNASYEMTVSGATLKWWTDRPELFTKLLNSGQGSSSELLENFGKWLNGLAAMFDVHLWGNGILFDNAMLKHHMGDEYPIHFRNDRDVRTIADLASYKLGITTSKLREMYYDNSVDAHDAFNDVNNQVAMVVGCWDILMHGERPVIGEGDVLYAEKELE